MNSTVKSFITGNHNSLMSSHCPVGGFGSGLPGAATDQLQAVSRAQGPQGQTGHHARDETGTFIS